MTPDKPRVISLNDAIGASFCIHQCQPVNPVEAIRRFGHDYRRSISQAAELNTIPKPEYEDNTPLDVATGLGNRYDICIPKGSPGSHPKARAQKWGRLVRTLDEGSGARPRPRSVKRHTQRSPARLDLMVTVLQERLRPYIIGAHLRTEARAHNELPEDPHYMCLSANSAKRRKDARRSMRPGAARPQGETDVGSSPDPGPSGEGPSSYRNINTTNDEELEICDLFGSRPLSDREGGSDTEHDPDFAERR